MKNLEILSEQEMRAINGGGLIASITGIVTNAIKGNWGGLATSIVETVQNGIKLLGSFFTSGW
ncbi:MAG: beta-class phenol-soluble modulin [Flavobacteriaceae bacterium]|jgi:hypothetical protein|nr:beta-class phenol-soluble modulin [Flavobacteriaceae bacterium]